MARKGKGVLIAVALLATAGLAFIGLTRRPTGGGPPPEMGGTQVKLILTSESEFHSSLPADVTATVNITASAGTLPITATVSYQILNPATNSWVILALVGGIPIATLNVPVITSRLFLPIDIQAAIGVSAGTFQMRVQVGLANMIGAAPPITAGPASFTLGVAPSGTVTITAA